jgi:hypothetical protein
VSEPRPSPGTDMRSGPAGAPPAPGPDTGKAPAGQDAGQAPAGQDAGQAPAPRNQGRRRRRLIAAALAVLLVAFCATTARLFMFPARGMPAHVDAIVMLGGRGDRFHEALELAHQHRAPYLVISLGSSFPGPEPRGSQPVFRCGPPIPRVTVLCFAPDPATTQGEAEEIGRLAARFHWHSVVLVTITPQDSRARLRIERCFSGQVYVMTGSMHAYAWPYEIAYEWAATIKALIFQRNC